MEGIADDRNILHRVLPQEKDNILSGIDWYGDTIFNGQQMAQFLPAWGELLARTGNVEERTLLATVQGFAQRCADGNHLYLKFIGD